MSAFAPLVRDPVYLKVFRAIEERIATGALADGAALPTEADLCMQFGVTRSSVREGIRLLEQSGLVARGAGKRLIVSKPGSVSVAAAASRGLSLGGATFREVFECLQAFFPQAARLAATRANAATHAALAENREALASASDQDADAIVAHAVAFFRILSEGLDNRVMLALLHALNLMIGESLREVVGRTPRARRRILEAQARIIDALTRRDGDDSETWMRKHVDDLKRGYAVAGVPLDRAVG
jgi:DNA-binding FadR family transcriptional regulator